MNAATTFLYFAYGSNLKRSEILCTCSTAERQFPALLPNYHLTFPRESIRRSCGVASIEPSRSREVWGGVYTISESDQAGLEEREGFQPNRPLSANSYFWKKLTVFENGDLSRPREVMTFLANRQPNPPLPSREYLGIIIAGAEEWNLDAQYIAWLKEIRTS